jgi:hypothetical protein
MAGLEELFSRDPNEWTREDLDVIVAELRAQRKNFLLTEEGKSNAARPVKIKSTAPAGAPKPPKPAKTAPVGQISLEALGITFNPPRSDCSS